MCKQQDCRWGCLWTAMLCMWNKWKFKGKMERCNRTMMTKKKQRKKILTPPTMMTTTNGHLDSSEPPKWGKQKRTSRRTNGEEDEDRGSRRICVLSPWYVFYPFCFLISTNYLQVAYNNSTTLAMKQVQTTMAAPLRVFSFISTTITTMTPSMGGLLFYYGDLQLLAAQDAHVSRAAPQVWFKFFILLY